MHISFAIMEKNIFKRICVCIYIYMTESLCCIMGINTIINQPYFNFKNYISFGAYQACMSKLRMQSEIIHAEGVIAESFYFPF